VVAERVRRVHRRTTEQQRRRNRKPFHCKLLLVTPSLVGRT
jgi:hypothetical protein